MSVGITMSITLIEFLLRLSHLAIPDTHSRKNEKVICKKKRRLVFEDIRNIYYSCGNKTQQKRWDKGLHFRYCIYTH